MTGVIIRNYRKSDYEITTRIMRELAQDYNFSFQEDRWKESSGLRLFSPGYKRLTLIAEMNGEVVGMGFIEVKTEPTGEKVGYLSNWGVAKEHHGEGIGQKLLEKATKIMEKMDVDAIRINFGYDVSKKLIELVSKVGFKPVAIAVEKVLKPPST